MSGAQGNDDSTVSRTSHAVPEVVLAVPNYNGARYLRAALQSLLAQTYANLRIILVDNCSTDDSLQLAQELTDARLDVHACAEHVNASANFNRALAAGKTADYVGLVHADDLRHPGFVQRLVDVLERNRGTEVAICNYDFVDTDGRVIERPTLARLRRTEAGPLAGDEFKRLLFRERGLPPAWLMRSDFAQAHHFSPRFPYAGDWQFWLRIFTKPEQVYVVTETLAAIRLHEANDTYSPTTLRGIHRDDALILAEALRNTAVDKRTARRARRLIDTRDALLVLQLLARRQPGAALRFLRDSVKSYGLRRVIAGWALLATLPEARQLPAAARARRRSH